MRRLLRIGAVPALLFLGFSALGQVSLEIKLNRTVYMQYEPIFAQVKMRNYSGQPLVFGENEKLKGELLFDVRDSVGLVPQLTADSYPMTGTILLPNETKEIVVPLNTYYKMNQLGTYRIYAYIKHGMLKDMFRSNEVKLEVNPGVVVWSRRVGVPEVLQAADPRKQSAVQERTYSIRMLVENASRFLYLVLEDDHSVYTVTRIGREIGVESYKVEIDMLSRIHLLVPISPKIFRYIIINVTGKPEEEKYLKSNAKTIPSLVRDAATGKVYVAGGSEAVPGVDYSSPVTGSPPPAR